MITYLEYERAKEQGQLESFILSSIGVYKSSEDYKWAKYGVDYSTGKNTEITNYRKIIYNVLGQAMEDNISPNHKITANFFGMFVRQRAAYVLGNGISFENDTTKNKLGREFDHLTFFAGQDSLTQGVVYGFWNLDHIEYFPAKEICPIFDDETGKLRVAIRFWQVSDDAPMRITLFEEDGITEYRTHRVKGEYEKTEIILITLREKTAYKHTVNITEADGEELTSGTNYSTLPIIPWYPNRQKQSYLVGLKDKIDAYDLLTSGLVNDVDGELIYWTLKNQGGMNDDLSLQSFLDKLKAVHAVVVDESDEATPHSVDPPTNARMITKESLRADLYRDAMALDVEILKAGNVTATQINAAYEPLNEAADEFEFCTIRFINELLELLGVDDYPKFTRSQERNKAEETDMVLSAAALIPRDVAIDKLPFLTPEEKEEAKRIAAEEDIARMTEEVE